MQSETVCERQAQDETIDALASVMEHDANMYNLLSRLYLEELEDEAIEALRKMRFPASSGNEYIDKGYRAIATSLSRIGDSAREELAIDYTRTFIGNGTDSYAAAYPLESVHAGRRRLVMQESRDEVLAIYRAYGFEKSDRLNEGEDHLACELAFMSLIAAECAENLRAGKEDDAEHLLKTQANFLEDHLMNWVPKLTIQMRHYAQTDFYKGVSYLTFGFLKECQEMLRETLV